jgi:hypothetical protein
MTIETTYTAAREQLKTLMDKVVDERHSSSASWPPSWRPAPTSPRWRPSWS